MKARDVLRAGREQWRLALAVFLAVTVLGTIFTLLTPRSYESSVTLYIASEVPDQNSSAAYQGGLLSQQRTRSYTQLLSSQRLAQEVVDQLRLPVTAQELSQDITTQSEDGTTLITATVRYPDPELVPVVANTLAESFAQLVGELERPVDGSRVPAVSARVAEPAVPPENASSPNVPVNIGLSLVLGALLAVAACAARVFLDTTVRNATVLRELVDAPLLGIIPKFDADAAPILEIARGTGEPAVEMFRQFRTNLQFVGVDSPPRVLMLTSSVPGEGKSTCAVNLTMALSAAGYSTVVVDADLRRPSLHELFGVDRNVGLSSVLARRVAVGEALQAVGQQGSVRLLASGPLPPNPSELLASQGVVELLDDLKARFDYVVVDTPPVLPVADASILAHRVEGVVLVARESFTARKQVVQAWEKLEAVSASNLGLLHNASETVGRSRYGYGYGKYGSYRSAFEAEDFDNVLSSKRGRHTPAQQDSTTTQLSRQGLGDVPGSKPTPSPRKGAGASAWRER